VDFDLSESQQSLRLRAAACGRELAQVAPAPEVIAACARADLLDPAIDLLGAAVVVEALAFESASAAIAYALHTSVRRGAASSAHDARAWLDELACGATVGALALSSDDVPVAEGGRLTGRASWVVPLTERGIAIVGATGADETSLASPASAGNRAAEPRLRTAWLTRLDAPGVRVDAVVTAGLPGLACGDLVLEGAACMPVGATAPIMCAVRILLASAGLGMGRRAMREALQAAKEYGRTGAGGEQTVQGLIADSATELDAAMLLTMKAASAAELSLAGASMAKLAATEATQRAVARATQVVGGDSFRQGHVLGRLAQDVRALELFAGRTEALREAVALETLPQAQ
jgi:alkylation response protein AidB-like acyl-CoA dehydrogenase